VFTFVLKDLRVGVGLGKILRLKDPLINNLSDLTDLHLRHGQGVVWGEADHSTLAIGAFGPQKTSTFVKFTNWQQKNG